MKSLVHPLILGVVTTALVSSAVAQPARAECSQPVKMIVSYPPGSPDDVIARIMAQKLSEAGGRFYVENLPGAGGMIGTATAAKALPDGCTMVIVNQNFVVQPAIGEKLAYEVPDSFTPVTLLVAAPETISVNPSVPATTIKELVALVHASPAKYNYASPGYGSSPHLASERLFKHTLGLDVVHVPFQGGPPAVTSTVAGHTQILHLTLPIVAPLVRDGKLRLLAIADKTRAPEFPSIPTLEEAGIPNHEVGFWDGILLPKGTPDDIVELRHRQIGQIMALPDVRDRLAGLGYTPINGSPNAFAAHLQTELSKWKAIVRDGNIKPE
ncbi:Bug family tripartite tricarboxylate transporter substrate binding protein [Rhodopseudomonas sp. P2A-2r]|uniref:Bug family tripartite tricarboxylate transporter substrate binding protein n=1 Tax=unclassified Rhodopseudomonas TaxID=2638247 RepID=UPI0022347C50|nr:tripartite tricarboxylate transporter substrate-binding protein [Rhodopseudomonas sp. P2A-2r]UZE49870.1 tripartite tricarboxylate transporter substrate-binding protein [Rhodopseudomonas sp. P2A-2r]